MIKIREVISHIARKILYSEIFLLSFRVFRKGGCYVCPICGYYGPFESIRPMTGRRRNARCPRCGSLERHRLQYLVFKDLARKIDTKELRMLHFAPEVFLRKIFKDAFKEYVTADLCMKNVDLKADLTELPFDDGRFDLVYASHVLEHIKDDHAALGEIKRVLRPGGIAILPVPVTGENTVEYEGPNPHDSGHVRCPGTDYYDRYREYFSTVQLYKSTDFGEKYQVYIYQKRDNWPAGIPLRPRVAGEKHIDIVPVCFK